MNDEFDFSNTFYEESEFLISEIESSILDLESSPGDQEIINSLFRAVHTLKGNSGMFGFDRVADIGHLMENVIGRIRENSLRANPEITDAFLSVIDVVKQLLEKKDVPEERINDLKNKLNHFLDDKFSLNSKAVENESNVYLISFKPGKDLFKFGLDPYANLEELRELGSSRVLCNVDDVPLLEKFDPEELYLSWEIEIETDSEEKTLEDVFLFVEDQSEIKITRPDHGALPDQSFDSEKNIEKRDSKSLKKVAGYLGKQDTNITISTKKLDNMVNLIGELVMRQARLSQEILSIEKSSLREMVFEMEESVEELRAGILDLRMTPIGIKFGSFRRLVRDLSGSLGKKLELFTFGEDTELDKSLIENMWDPLVHLIRNSVDHGIETPEERVAAGKNETGRIVVAARTKESRVEISISDDGKGIDSKAILKKAVNKGLISEDSELSEKEILNLIFLPGFSTSETISDISGRGVGMDAVKKKVEEVNGEVSIDTIHGEGTTMTISLPLTLAIVDVLMVEAGGLHFVIPLALIEECFELSEYKVKGDRDRHILLVRDENIPYFRLKDIFELETEIEEDFEEQVIVVQHGVNKVGIVVDKLIKSQQAVIKSMRKWYKRNEGISGATVLGDGSLAYVLDIVQVVRLGLESEKRNQL